MIDYEILRAIWWLFIGVLLVGFAIMDGQDMGVGTLLPFLSKDDTERRCMINSVAPHWDGNQVWLITGGGAIFAAWPLVYAAAFSGFYWAMLIVLMALIFRPVGFDYRGKVECTKWRSTWDWLLFVGSAVPPIIFGVAFGNLLQGVPFHFDDSMRPIYTGNFFGLLNPFGLLCGVVSLLMFVFHGANYGPSNPLLKTVDVYAGAWFTNFSNYPVLWIVPALAVICSVLGVFFVKQLKGLMAILCSSMVMLGVILTPLLAMFPFIMPSSTDPRSSLTIWDCTSSQLTLEVMFFVTLIFLPIVLIYTGWAYKTMSGKLNAEYIRKNDHQLY